MADSRILTSTEKQTILRLYETKVNGQLPTIRAVAAQVGRSFSAVKRVVENAGVYRPERTPITTGERKRIIRLYRTKNGTRWMSTIEISKLVGRDAKTVWLVVAEAGVNRDRTESQRDLVTDEQRQAILHLSRTTRLGHLKIAKRLGMSRHTVSQVLTEAGERARRGHPRRAVEGVAPRGAVHHRVVPARTVLPRGCRADRQNGRRRVGPRAGSWPRSYTWGERQPGGAAEKGLREARHDGYPSAGPALDERGRDGESGEGARCPGRPDVGRVGGGAIVDEPDGDAGGLHRGVCLRVREAVRAQPARHDANTSFQAK
jgi:hypothetical protein